MSWMRHGGVLHDVYVLAADHQCYYSEDNVVLQAYILMQRSYILLATHCFIISGNIVVICSDLVGKQQDRSSMPSSHADETAASGKTRKGSISINQCHIQVCPSPANAVIIMQQVSCSYCSICPAAVPVMPSTVRYDYEYGTRRRSSRIARRRGGRRRRLLLKVTVCQSSNSDTTLDLFPFIALV